MAMLRACNAGFSELRSLWRAVALVHTSSSLQLLQRDPEPRTNWSRSPTTAPAATKALAVRSPPSPLQRTMAYALNAIHRLVLLLGTIKKSANEEYVRQYLQHVGLDSFALERVSAVHPSLFRLSVAKDIEPAISWLRSLGISGDQLTELVHHTPGVLSASVDEQLEPLAAFVRQAGGSPRDVLLSCPDIATVPVASLQSTRQVLRQLDATDSDIALLLVLLPDLYTQLALTLRRLFVEYGVAAWKLYGSQRQQLRGDAGRLHHHLTRWSRVRGQAGSAMDVGQLPATGGILQSTSYLLDQQVYHGLVQAQAALKALAQKVDDLAGLQQAVLELQDAIDMLAELPEPGAASREEAQAAA